MEPSENNDEDGSRKPTRPFLRKGEGTARFRMPSQGRKCQGEPGVFQKSNIESPAISLPRFTPSSCIPTSARTVDSGISNEDETRPPTTASLPLDNQSSSRLSHFEPQNRAAHTVVEEHEDSGHHVDCEEHIERVSARPSLNPDEGASLADQCSDVSDDAAKLRAEAIRLQKIAPNVHSLRSFSTTQSSYESSLTGPAFHSTPKSYEEQEISFQPPSLLPSSYHVPGSLSSASLETPQARPFATNHANFVTNEAQTGISLLNNHPRHRVISSRHHEPFNQDQKENIEEDALEHVYDQPLQVSGRRGHSQIDKQKQERLIQKKLEHNLKIQLRDAIAHLDFSSEEVWKTKKKLEADYSEAKKKLDLKRKELDQEFEQKVETLQENLKADEERLQRERRDLEREKKILQKGKGEREKELLEMSATLREKLTNSETLNSKLRQEVRNLNDKNKKKEEEIEKLIKDYNRSKSTCQTLEKRIKQLRFEKEREEKEKEMFAKVATNRKSPHQTLFNQSLTGTATTSSASSRNPSASSMASNRKTSTNKGRTVSFADEPQEQSLDVIEKTLQPEAMVPYETIPTKLGPCTHYCDSLGKSTKGAPTVANGILFEYHNNDFRWMNRQNSVQIYRYAVDKTIKVHLVQFGISLNYTHQRQLEVIRPGNNVTLISVKRREIRTELYGRDNGSYYTEIFEADGRIVTKDFVHNDVIKETNLGTTCSHRDNGTRYVQYCTALDDFELVEPEFRLRWYKGEVMVCKIIKRHGCNEKTLRLEVNLVTGDGILEAVESQLKDGVSQKQTVFPWSG